MAEYRKIVIEIMSSENSGNGNDNGEGSGEELNDKVKIPNQTSLSKQNSSKEKVLNSAKKKAKDMLLQQINIDASRYFNLSENYLAENDYNNAKRIISSAVSDGTAIATGFMAGGIVGGVVATVATGINEINTYKSRMSSYYQALNASNYQATFSQVRAGLTNGGKGTEN